MNVPVEEVHVCILSCNWRDRQMAVQAMLYMMPGAVLAAVKKQNKT